MTTRHLLSLTTLVAIIILTACSRNSPVDADMAESTRNTVVIELQIIETAKELWALENKKRDGDTCVESDLKPYLPDKKIPKHPKGGRYVINPIGKNAESTTYGPLRETKEGWKAKLGAKHQLFNISGAIQMPKIDFLQSMGEPDKTQTIEGQTFWYYECRDGLIQLNLNESGLKAGIVQGNVNDF